MSPPSGTNTKSPGSNSGKFSSPKGKGKRKGGKESSKSSPSVPVSTPEKSSSSLGTTPEKSSPPSSKGKSKGGRGKSTGKRGKGNRNHHGVTEKKNRNANAEIDSTPEDKNRDKKKSGLGEHEYLSLAACGAGHKYGEEKSGYVGQRSGNSKLERFTQCVRCEFAKVVIRNRPSTNSRKGQTFYIFNDKDNKWICPNAPVEVPVEVPVEATAEASVGSDSSSSNSDGDLFRSVKDTVKDKSFSSKKSSEKHSKDKNEGEKKGEKKNEKETVVNSGGSGMVSTESSSASDGDLFKSVKDKKISGKTKISQDKGSESKISPDKMSPDKIKGKGSLDKIPKEEDKIVVESLSESSNSDGDLFKSVKDKGKNKTSQINKDKDKQTSKEKNTENSKEKIPKEQISKEKISKEQVSKEQISKDKNKNSSKDKSDANSKKNKSISKKTVSGDSSPEVEAKSTDDPKVDSPKVDEPKVDSKSENDEQPEGHNFQYILGSQSKFRREIAEKYWGSDTQFLRADIDEKAIRDDNPNLMVQKIARGKAEKLKNEIKDSVDAQNRVERVDSDKKIEKTQIERADIVENVEKKKILVCCDQVVMFQNEVREKAETEEQLRSYIKSYQSNPYDPITCVNGICLYSEGKSLQVYESSSWRGFVGEEDKVGLFFQVLYKGEEQLKCSPIDDRILRSRIPKLNNMVYSRLIDKDGFIEDLYKCSGGLPIEIVEDALKSGNISQINGVDLYVEGEEENVVGSDKAVNLTKEQKSKDQNNIKKNPNMDSRTTLNNKNKKNGIDIEDLYAGKFVNLGEDHKNENPKKDSTKTPYYKNTGVKVVETFFKFPVRGTIDSIRGLPIKTVENLSISLHKLVQYGSVRYFLFDMDGLLLNTEELYDRGFRELLKKYDRGYDMSTKKQIMGRKAYENAKVLVRVLNLEDVFEDTEATKQPPNKGKKSLYQFLEERNQILEPMFEKETEFIEGALELLYHIKFVLKMPLCLATSSPRKLMMLKTKKHRLIFDEIFGENVICGDEVLGRGKPEPEIFEMGLRKLMVEEWGKKNSSPIDPRWLKKGKAFQKHCRRAMVFEDAPTGVQAGRKMGGHVVMVPDKRLPRKLTEGTNMVLSSLSELHLEQFVNSDSDQNWPDKEQRCAPPVDFFTVENVEKRRADRSENIKKDKVEDEGKDDDVDVDSDSLFDSLEELWVDESHDVVAQEGDGQEANDGAKHDKKEKKETDPKTEVKNVDGDGKGKGLNGKRKGKGKSKVKGGRRKGDGKNGGKTEKEVIDSSRRKDEGVDW